MGPLRLPLLAVLLALALVAAAGAPTGVAAQQTATPADGTSVPLGERVSGFMQSSTAQADTTVENGMWEAAFENAPAGAAQRALVRERVDGLNASLHELQAEREALREQYENGEINRTEYRARLAAVVGRLAALGDGIRTTQQRAAAVGVNASRLEQLRANARGLAGAEVAEMARNLTGGSPPGQGGVFDEGPPGQTGDRGNGPSAGDSGSGTGPPADAGQGGGQGPPTATPTPHESDG